MTLEIRDLSKRYGNNWVLRDVSFDVEPGNVLAILGASRSGKSTLLKILAGREKPSPPEKQFGINGRLVALDKGKSQVKRLRFFSADKSDHVDLSQRISDLLGSAADIVAFDDPLCGADRIAQDQLIKAIRKQTSEKRLTTIYATSDFETAAIIADRVAVFGDGFIQQTGTPEEIYTAPQTSAVARLSGRCNIFSARRLTSTKFEIPEFQTIDGEHRLFAERADISKLGAINRNVSLAIRPEDISMSFGASFPEDNLLKAVVTGIKYLGPMTIVELNASGLSLEAAVLRLVGLDVGQECVIGLPPDRVRILKD
jgi:ABC-type Fe3+/spermidine/putrescine transport system ATPase subunit